MPNRIKPKRSYTANAVPVVSGGTPDIERNEIAINWADSKLYTRNNSDQLVSITLGGGGGGGSGSIVTAATVSAFPATGSSSGVIYVATDTARAYIWAGAYIEVGANGGGGSGLSWSSVPASATATGTAGLIAYDSDYLYVATAANTWERAALSTWVNFTPASVTGLQAWYDASDASTLFDATSGGSLVAADGAVARWEDKSGNGRHATQATSGSRPIRKSNQRNGLDAILFDGTNDFLSLGSITIPASHSVFQVYQRSGGVQSLGIAGDGRYASLWFTDGVLYQISNADFTTHGTSSASTGYFLVSTIRNATASIEMRRNGSTVSSVTTGAGVTNAASGGWEFIGNRGGGNFHSGHLCEIIVYDTALSGANRAAVESYLMSKFAIA
jgi:hypothetical protein